MCISASWGNKENFEKHSGWEVLVLKEKNERAMTSEFGDWRKEKTLLEVNGGNPGAKDHPEMVKFVDEWLSKWIGFAEETIFEVNMLSISPELIPSLNKQKDVHDKLKQHGIEPIYCRFRHRNFWDAGLHCLTVDTLREGGQQNYGL